MSIELLKQKLEDPNFYKQNIPNLFFIFSFWKKAHQEYQTAEEKKIVPNTLLRSAEHEDFFYNTYAISTEGEIDGDMAARLKSFAQSLELGEIRYMAHATNGFFPLLDENGVNVDNPDMKLGIPNLYIFTVSDTKPAKIDCPYSVLIKNGKAMKKWPICRSALS
jgi:hypothetical protein